jgi:hypothetical protein
MKEIAKFESEKALQAFVKKNGMRFANACIDNDLEDEVGWIKAARSRGLAVVWLADYTLGKGAYLAFHRRSP